MKDNSNSVFPNVYGPFAVPGLTKREYFAAIALQALIAKYGDPLEPDCFYEEESVQAKAAVEFADALITALHKGAANE